MQVNNLTKIYNKNIVVKQINFQLRENKCIALIGPNGAGKTTTLRMLTGLIKPTSGEIKYAQHNKNNQHIGYLPQHPVFHEWMTGIEFLVYCARLAYMEKQTASKKADKLLEKVGLESSKNKRISTYSGGMKQRLGIAQAMIHQPYLLILDEPVSALDPIGRREIITLLEQLKQEMTILFSTHILTDAEEISDELIVLHEGEVVESGEIERLRKKYQTAKIELEFDDELTKYEEVIKRLPTVVSTTMQRNILHIAVTNMEEARQEILQQSVQSNWPLIHFNVNRASLEDMFMKVVK